MTSQPRNGAAIEAELPPLPVHPDAHAFRWTSSEAEAIQRYGQECAQAALNFAARAAIATHVAKAPAAGEVAGDRYVGTRLRLVCKLVGVPVPDGDDKHIAECAFTLLGTVRAALERVNAALINSVGLTIAELADPKHSAPPAPAASKRAEADWEHLKQYGYAPGGYMFKCHACGTTTEFADKRAITCRRCAEATYAKNGGAAK